MNNRVKATVLMFTEDEERVQVEPLVEVEEGTLLQYSIRKHVSPLMVGKRFGKIINEEGVVVVDILYKDGTWEEQTRSGRYKGKGRKG